jgi:hypothetical protein
MNIPVNNQHALTLGRKRCRTHRNVIEQAKSHCAVCVSVMSRWSHWDKGDAFTLQLQDSDRLEAGAGSSTGRREGVHAGMCICIDVSAALQAKPLEFVEVFGRVHPRQSSEVSFRRSDVLDGIVEVEITHSIHHREDPARLLRVECAPVVCIRTRWASDYQHSPEI